MTLIYCVKCKKKTSTLHTKLSTTKNNRSVLKGKCGVCGTTKNMFVKKKIIPAVIL